MTRPSEPLPTDDTRLQSRIIAWLTENLPSSRQEVRIGPDTSLLDEIGLDSVQIVELVSFLEAEFDVAIPGDALTPENFEDVSSICRMLTRLRQNSAR